MVQRGSRLGGTTESSPPPPITLPPEMDRLSSFPEQRRNRRLLGLCPSVSHSVSPFFSWGLLDREQRRRRVEGEPSICPVHAIMERVFCSKLNYRPVDLQKIFDAPLSGKRTANRKVVESGQEGWSVSSKHETLHHSTWKRADRRPPSKNRGVGGAAPKEAVVQIRACAAQPRANDEGEGNWHRQDKITEQRSPLTRLWMNRRVEPKEGRGKGSHGLCVRRSCVRSPQKERKGSKVQE